MKNVGRLRRWVVATLTIALLGAGFVAFAPAPQAQAAQGSQFDPGNIISDQNFFDSNSMSTSDIWSFFASKSCSPRDGVPCLQNFAATTKTIPAAGPNHCAQYTGLPNESAASIVFRVAQACRISPKVLLVLMQKEQSLITNPSAYGYQRAMGWGCPDSGPNHSAVCDADYFGFQNQVYKSAWQFRQYTAFPGGRAFHIGNSYIQYHPDAARCGGSTVNILNQATANLYIYTPYQPNASALANLYGTGDGCSAYGNRNFWRLYTDWFGNPTTPAGTPVGSLDSVTTVPGGVTLDGWAVDPDSVSSPVTLSIQLGSTWQVLYANKAGENLDGQFPGAGSNHKFSGTLSAVPGRQTMCVYLVNAGGAGSTGNLGCRTVDVPAAPAARGAITQLSATSSTISFAGWVVRPDTPLAPVPVAINVGSNWYAFSTGSPSPEAQQAVPGASPNQGVTGTFPASPGLNNVCIWAASSSGATSALACRTILVPEPASLLKDVQSISATASSIDFSGWAIWPDAVTSAVPIAVNIGANWYPFSADQANAAAQAALPAAGPNHGFSGSIPAKPGRHDVCIWASKSTGGAQQLGCREVTVAASGAATAFELESVVGASRQVNFAGWALWPAAEASAVPIAVNIGSSWYPFSADQPSARAQQVMPGVGPNHGYAGSIPVAPGVHNVCVWAAQQNAAAVMLGCRSVEVVAGLATVGELQGATSGVGGVHFEGWAVGPENPTAPIAIAATIAGQWIAYPGDKANSTAPSKFNGAGPNQGFSGLFPAPVGTHELCVWATSVSGPVPFGCRTVEVKAAPAVAGGIVTATGVAGGISVTGWAAWPSAATTPVPIAANVGSQWTALPSNLPSTATAEFMAGAGPDQGFAGTVAAPSGAQTVCIWASPPAGSAVMLGCSPVTVP